MNTVARKLVHISFGACALLLRWLPWWGAALMAASAVVFNLFLLPRMGGKRISEGGRGYDLGIILYPLAVLALVLAFPDQPAIAGTIWAILAFGDGFATLAGQAIPGPRIPWNSDKSLAGTLGFIMAALPTALFLAYFLGLNSKLLGVSAVVGLTVIVCAIVETLPLHVDDNFTVPLIGALTLFSLVSISRLPRLELDRNAALWLGLNAVLALLGFVLGLVTRSGMIGGFLLGAVLIVFGRWQLFAVLLAFFIIGSLATRIGYRKKAQMEIAQERGGRRGFSHAFANAGVATILAVLMRFGAGDPTVLMMAAIASLATATADTIGSEIGPLIGRRAFLPLTFRRVPPGTEGAISLEGTLAGALGAFLVSTLGIWLLQGNVIWAHVGICTLAAVLGSYIESIAGSWNRKRMVRVPNTAMNFFNTLVGALLVIVAASFR